MLLKNSGKAAGMAFSGIVLALSFILMLLGSVIEASTLFFLAAAAFCIGIIIREQGLKAGAAFLAASLLLGFFLGPNKLYVLTYGCIEAYLFLRELLWEMMDRRAKKQQDSGMALEGPGKRNYLLGKFVIFQLLFLPLVFLVPQIFYTGEITLPVRLMMILAGEVAWIVADMAYDVFQRQIWGRMRRRLNWSR